MFLINKTLLELSKGLRRYIVAIAALKLVVLAGMARFAGIMSGFMGNLAAPSMTAEDLKNAILAAVAAAAVMLAGELLIGELEHRCTAKSRLLLRGRIFSKLLELDVGNIEKIGASNAVSDAVDGVESMQPYYSKYLPALLYCMTAPFYLFFRLREISLPAAVVLFAASLIMMPINNRFRSAVNVLKEQYWVSFRDLTAYYLESLRALTTIKLFNQDELRGKTLRQKADTFCSRIMDVMKLNFSAFLVTETLMYGAMTAAVLIACFQLRSGVITLESALMLLMLSYSFFTGVRQLMTATHQALTGIAAAQNIADILDIDTTRPQKTGTERREDTDGIVIEGVDFSYDGRRQVLRGADLRFRKGEMTAIVGPSGCGKSTVASLLMRFMDPQKGYIGLEGEDYLSMSPEALRRRVVLVPQSVSIFSGTIGDNLRLAAPNATEEELRDALERVRLLSWVESLPQGLESDVGDGGARLSGGQRQKIGIARALLSKAPYIIFDEATSSVDVDSENEIWSCINELAPARTPIVISHRLSTIAQADRIYVLQEGRAAEEGDHDSLMARDGLYRRLVEEQAALERHGERRLGYAQ